MLVNEFLEKNAKLYLDKTAVIHQKNHLNYSQLNHLSDVYASILINNGIKKGDRVIIFLDNSIEYLIAYFAILKIGAVIVALNTKLVSRELIDIFNDCSPKLIITDERHSEIIKDAEKKYCQRIDVVTIEKNNVSSRSYCIQPIAFSENDLAMIIYTSGTTGKPKGVMLSHTNLSANADSIIEYLHLTANDKIMVVMPFFYSYGNSLLTTHIKVGGTLVIDNRFLYPNIVLDNMIKEEVTGFAGVPSTFSILLKKSAIRKYHFPKLRYATQAGGAMLPPMIEEFIKIVPDIKFYVMYGQTEASARLTYLDPKYLKKKMGSVGKAIPGVELIVMNKARIPVKPGETGEIVARGKNIMMGYWNAPEETTLVLHKEGLFTGDLARVDEDGFIYIVGRKKDMIKSGAYRISPIEIEDIVCQIPGIVECAVVGIQDKILGEAVGLFVVGDGSLIEEKVIISYCKKNLASYKIPKKIEIVSELPKTTSGKIKRRKLNRFDY